MSLARDIITSLFDPDRDPHAIPVLDGALSPNNRLDGSQRLGERVPSIDDFALGPDGALYVSSDRQILRCEGEDFSERRVWARFESPVGGLAWTPSMDRLLACVSGVGIIGVDREGVVKDRLTNVSGYALSCPTSVVVAADGSVHVTNGSSANRPEDWLTDLMQGRPPSGAIVRCGPDFRDPIVLARDLSWPNGATISHDERKLLFVETWRHVLSALDRASGRIEPIVTNLAGYPARLSRGRDDDYWLAFLALRTELIEFVLREPRFRERMMREIPRDYWIGPALAATNGYLEPTQLGGIKKLGIQKAWSPPRSYGLVARLDGEFNPIESFHSRVGGNVHGVLAARVVGDDVLAGSKGHHCLVRLAETGGRP
jgi:hypothetical protein